MTRIVITEDEVWPVYGITKDLETLAAFSDAVVEVDQAFIDEFNRARDAWDAVQAKLGDLTKARKERNA